jgi:hypothetical protein
MAVTISASVIGSSVSENRCKVEDSLSFIRAPPAFLFCLPNAALTCAGDGKPKA